MHTCHETNTLTLDSAYAIVNGADACHTCTELAWRLVQSDMDHQDRREALWGRFFDLIES
jgi:hypothetical protein